MDDLKKLDFNSWIPNWLSILRVNTQLMVTCNGIKSPFYYFIHSWDPFQRQKSPGYFRTLHDILKVLINFFYGDKIPQADILFLKHACSILKLSCNPVCGFSIMEQVRFCAVWPMENWRGSSMNHIQSRASYLSQYVFPCDCLRMLQACFRQRMSALRTRPSWRWRVSCSSTRPTAENSSRGTSGSATSNRSVVRQLYISASISRGPKRNKFGNVWVFVQLICRQTGTKNKLCKIPNIA